MDVRTTVSEHIAPKCLSTQALLLVLFLVCSGCLRPVFGHGDLHEQIEAVTRQISQSPKDASLFLKRGDLHRLHQEWVAAFEDLERAARIDPGLAAIDLVRAKIWFDSNRPEPAKRSLDRFLQKEPTHVEGLLTRAKALMRLEDWAAAAADFARAIANCQKPEPEYYTARAQALRSTTPPGLDEALRCLDEGMEKLGPLVSLQLPAIEIELAQRRYDQALQRLDQAGRHSPRQESWLIRRAEILRQAGRPVEAREACLAALQAIETLPERLRKTRATERLEAKARSALALLASPEENSPPEASGAGSTNYE